MPDRERSDAHLLESQPNEAPRAADHIAHTDREIAADKDDLFATVDSGKCIFETKLRDLVIIVRKIACI